MGKKYDQEKPRMDLLSSLWLEAVSKVLTFGAKKYAAHDWRDGIERSRLIAAAFRHLSAYNRGEDFDKETGLSHLAHASCFLMFMTELHETRPDLDDRYKGDIEPHTAITEKILKDIRSFISTKELGCMCQGCKKLDD